MYLGLKIIILTWTGSSIFYWNDRFQYCGPKVMEKFFCIASVFIHYLCNCECVCMYFYILLFAEDKNLCEMPWPLCDHVFLTAVLCYFTLVFCNGRKGAPFEWWFEWVDVCWVTRRLLVLLVMREREPHFSFIWIAWRTRTGEILVKNKNPSFVERKKGHKLLHKVKGDTEVKWRKLAGQNRIGQGCAGDVWNRVKQLVCNLRSRDKKFFLLSLNLAEKIISA